jgi:hypothetical protein
VGDRSDVFENAVASLVDLTSIMVAYQIGAYNFGLGSGLAYGCFDAFLVVWMRKPISRFARWVNPLRARDQVRLRVPGRGEAAFLRNIRNRASSSQDGPSSAPES